MRELARELLYQNMTAENCAIGVRVVKIMEKLKISEEKFEDFLTNIFEFSQQMGIKEDVNDKVSRRDNSNMST